jgi:hypothetical protein
MPVVEHVVEDSTGPSSFSDKVIEKVALVITKLKIDVSLKLVHNIIKGGDTTQPLYSSA